MSIPKSTPPSMAIHEQLAAHGNEQIRVRRRIIRRVVMQRRGPTTLHVNIPGARRMLNQAEAIQSSNQRRTGWENGSGKGWDAFNSGKWQF